MAHQIQFVGRTGSTNGDLVSRLTAGEAIPEGYWLVADRQDSGRGRQGRTWLDGAGNFMGSTIVRLSPLDPPPQSLTFCAALALREASLPWLSRPEALSLKWPNDVLLDGAKFCGILLEHAGQGVVVGIGVNLAAAPVVEGRETRALAQGGAFPLRDAYADALAAAFTAEMAKWREFGIGPLLSRWTAAAHPFGTPLSVHDVDGKILRGQFAGLADDGALRLRAEDGTTHVVHAGDVMLEAS